MLTVLVSETEHDSQDDGVTYGQAQRGEVVE